MSKGFDVYMPEYSLPRSAPQNSGDKIKPMENIGLNDLTSVTAFDLNNILRVTFLFNEEQWRWTKRIMFSSMCFLRYVFVPFCIRV